MKTFRKYRIYPIEILYLILISLAVFLAPLLFGLAKDALFQSSLHMKKIMEFDIDEKTPNKKGFLIKDKLMIQSGETLFCYGPDGKQEWTRPLKSANTNIIKWNDNYVISDLSSGRLALVDDNNNIVAENTVKGKITDIAVSRENIYLLLDNENKLIIMNAALEPTGQIEHKHGDVIRIACDFESSELILYTSSIESGELKTFCIVYDNKGNIIASLDLNGALIFDIFVEDNIVMISDQSFLVFNRLVRPLAEFAYSTGITDTDFKNAKLYVISNASEGNVGEKELKVYDSSLNQVNITKLPETAAKVAAGEKYLISASDQRISVMDANLKILQEINLKGEISELKWMSEDSFYIVGNNKLIIYANK